MMMVSQLNSAENEFFRTRGKYIPVRSAAASLLLTVLQNSFSALFRIGGISRLT